MEMTLERAADLAADLRPRNASKSVSDLALAFTTIPDKTAGDPFTEAMWDTYLRDNGNSGYVRLIAETTLGASAANVDFTSIPTTFSHLLLTWQARSDAAVTASTLLVRFNGDSAANYAWEKLDAIAAAASAASFTAQTSIQIDALVGASAPASQSGFGHAWIPNYLGVTFFKQISLIGGQSTYAQLHTGLWSSTAAINRVTILPTTGNFVAGTRFSLYGVPS